MSRLIGLLPHALTQKLVQKLYGRPVHDTFPTYYRLNSGLSLRRTARRAGMKVAGMARFVNPDYFSFSPWLRRAAIVIDYWLGRFHPELGRLYFVCTLNKPVVEVHSVATHLPTGSRTLQAA